MRVRDGPTKESAKRSDINNIYRARRITGLELQQEVSADTANAHIRNDAFASQGACRISNPAKRRPANTIALIEDNDVNIDSSSSIIG